MEAMEAMEAFAIVAVLALIRFLPALWIFGDYVHALWGAVMNLL